MYITYGVFASGGFGHDMLISSLECLILIRTESCSTLSDVTTPSLESDLPISSRIKPKRFVAQASSFPHLHILTAELKDSNQRITGYDPPEVDVS